MSRIGLVLLVVPRLPYIYLKVLEVEKNASCGARPFRGIGPFPDPFSQASTLVFVMKEQIKKLKSISLSIP